MADLNDELKARLVKYLDALEGAAGKAQDFAAAEVPETVREWLVWVAIERFGVAAIFLAGAVIAAVVARKLYTWGRDHESSCYDDTRGMCYSGSAMASCVALGLTAGFCTWAMAGAKAVIAPRAVVVEEVARLVNGHQPGGAR